MAFANLGISLTARVRPLARGLKRARSQVRGFVRSIRRMATRSRTLFAGVATAASVAITRQTITSVDALGKMSDQLGIATEKLGTLRHAARLSGVGFSQLDMGLQRMVRRVSEAANGTGEAQDALRELGLDASELAQRTPDAQFHAIADAMADVENQSDRVRLAFKLFDSEGVKLVNTLRLVEGKGFRRMEAEATRLGVALKREQVDRFTEANDQWTRAQVAIQGLTILMVSKMLPIVERISDAIVSWTGEQTDANDELGRTPGIFGQITEQADLAIRKMFAFGRAIKEGDFANAFARAGSLRTESEIARTFTPETVRRAQNIRDAEVFRLERTTGGRTVDIKPELERANGFLEEIRDRLGIGGTAKAG